MIVGICGYGYTGSGAVLDLIKETDSCRLIETEFMLPYFPDGLEDLAYHLVEQPSRFFSSDIALLRFRELTRKMAKQPGNVCNRASHGEFGRLSDEYIQAITQIVWKGYWVVEPFIAENDAARIKRKVLRHVIPRRSALREKACRDLRFSIRPEAFYEKTEAYLKAIVGEKGNSEMIVINQPFPANAPGRSMKLFGKGTKAVIVDRDPRDVYLLCRDHVKTRWVPTDSVEKFITYYQQLHAFRTENPDILYLRFEDLVFDYENTKDRIFRFLGVDPARHTRKRQFFNPDVSAGNTLLFRKDTAREADIRRIEAELKEYLYPFPETGCREYAGGDIF